MARAILICARPPGGTLPAARVFDDLNRRLSPDNIDPKPPVVVAGDGLALAVLNPNDSIPMTDTAVCLGVMVNPRGEWHRPGTPIPDGTYALFRADRDRVELINDPVASRTIWYIHTDSLFIASTSQRAIVTLLGSFEPNPEVIPWMLSAGQLGPYNS